jgi:hypothetical protein
MDICCKAYTRNLMHSTDSIFDSLHHIVQLLPMGAEAALYVAYGYSDLSHS